MSMSGCFPATNQPAAGKAGIAVLLAVERHFPGLPELGTFGVWALDNSKASRMIKS